MPHEKAPSPAAPNPKLDDPKLDHVQKDDKLDSEFWKNMAIAFSNDHTPSKLIDKRTGEPMKKEPQLTRIQKMLGLG